MPPSIAAVRRQMPRRVQRWYGSHGRCRRHAWASRDSRMEQVALSMRSTVGLPLSVEWHGHGHGLYAWRDNEVDPEGRAGRGSRHGANEPAAEGRFLIAGTTTAQTGGDGGAGVRGPSISSPAKSKKQKTPSLRSRHWRRHHCAKPAGLKRGIATSSHLQYCYIALRFAGSARIVAQIRL